jgi:hypothetical protein
MAARPEMTRCISGVRSQAHDGFKQAMTLGEVAQCLALAMPRLVPEFHELARQ